MAVNPYDDKSKILFLSSVWRTMSLTNTLHIYELNWSGLAERYAHVPDEK